MPPLAKITDRFLAYLVDILPFALAYYAGLAFATAPRWALVAGLGTLFVLYHAVMNARGATLGKRLLGIRVVRLDGTPLDFRTSLIRSLGYIPSTPLFNLGYLWSLWDGRNRAWHDLLAGTLVVESGARSEGSTPTRTLIAFGCLAVLLSSFFWLGRLAPTPEDLEAVERANQGLQALAQLEEVYRSATGAYTDSLLELARASGDVAEFKASMAKIFDSRRFRIAASRDRYSIQARALDRRRTAVSISGP